MLTLSHFAAILRAAADKADQLAEAEAASAETRTAEREAVRRERASADVGAVVQVVQAHPGIGTGPLRAALVSAGLSAERAALGIDTAILSGVVLASGGPRSRAHFPPGADSGEVVP